MKIYVKPVKIMIIFANHSFVPCFLGLKMFLKR